MTIEQRENLLNLLIYDMETTKDIICIDKETFIDKRVEREVSALGNYISREVGVRKGQLKTLLMMDEESFLSGFIEGVKNFFGAIFKFMKKIIFFWQSDDDSKEKVDKSKITPDFPLEDVKHAIAFGTSMGHAFDTFGYNAGGYKRNILSTIALLEDVIIHGKTKFKATEATVRMVTDETITKKIGRFFKKLSRNDYETYITHLGVRLKDNAYEHTTLNYSVYGGRVITLVTGFQDVAEICRIDLVDNMSEDEKRKGLLTFIDIVNDVTDDSKNIVSAIKDIMDKVDKHIDMIEKKLVNKDDISVEELEKLTSENKHLFDTISLSASEESMLLFSGLKEVSSTIGIILKEMADMQDKKAKLLELLKKED